LGQSGFRGTRALRSHGARRNVSRFRLAALRDPAASSTSGGGETPNFRDIATDAGKLEEYRWCFDWLLADDPYAALMVQHASHRPVARPLRHDRPSAGTRAQPAAGGRALRADEEARQARLRGEGDEQRIWTNYR